MCTVHLFLSFCLKALILLLSLPHKIKRFGLWTTMSSQCIGFRKIIVKSHLFDRFTVKLPRAFCGSHLPFHDGNIILVDESEQQYNVRYVAKYCSLVRGWRDFAVSQGLLEGDIAFFDMIDRCKFKVHIIRPSEFRGNKPVDPVILSDLSEENTRIGDTAIQKCLSVSCAVESHQERMLCRNKKRVHEEVVPAGKKHLKVSLSPQYINFCKVLHRHHVSKRNPRLGVPREFCRAHLPRHNTSVILVGENQRAYNVRYGVSNCRLQGGWGDFACAHGLVEGDTLVFQLIDSCKFKVHIARATGSITNVFKNNMPVDFVKREDIIEENAYIGDTATQKKHPVSRSGDGHLVGKKPRLMNDVMLSPMNKMVHEERVPIEKVYVRRKHRSTETNGASAAPLGFENSESTLNLKDFDDFKICFNGKMLDPEIPEHIRIKYFELCRVQKRFLHEHVKKDLNSKLVISMTLDIISIAESTQATGISTRLHHLEGMDRTLKSFEDLGMTVGSLRAKLGKLIKILNEHHSVAESTIVRLEAIECERKAFMEEKKKIDELIESAMARGKIIGCLEANVDSSKEKMDKLSLMLKKISGLTQ